MVLTPNARTRVGIAYFRSFLIFLLFLSSYLQIPEFRDTQTLRSGWLVLVPVAAMVL